MVRWPDPSIVRKCGVEYALPVAYVFTGWVVVNSVLFTMINRNAPRPPLYFAIGTLAIGIGIPLATAIILN